MCVRKLCVAKTSRMLISTIESTEIDVHDYRQYGDNIFVDEVQPCPTSTRQNYGPLHGTGIVVSLSCEHVVMLTIEFV